MQLPNDYARLVSPVLQSGKYSIEFYFHATGSALGGLDVYARKESSQFGELVWYYTGKFNGTFSSWTYARVEVSSTSSFKVS